LAGLEITEGRHDRALGPNFLAISGSIRPTSHKAALILCAVLSWCCTTTLRQDDVRQQFGPIPSMIAMNNVLRNDV
jgi:hypothetical protein